MDTATKIEKTKQELKNVNLERQEINYAKIKLLNRKFSWLLKDKEILSPGDELDITDSSIIIKRPHPDLDYKKEVMTLYFQVDSWKDNTVTKIKPSFYTTSVDSSFELERMVLIGKVGSLILQEKTELLKLWNDTQSIFKDKERELLNHKRELEKEIRELEKEKRAQEKAALLEKTNSGLEFIENKYGNLPTFYRNDTDAYTGVKKFKIVKVSKTGKTATVYLIRNINAPYNNKPVILENTLKRVRMKVIHEFLYVVKPLIKK